MRLTMLTVFGDRNAIGKVLDGEDDGKLQYPTFAMPAQKRLASACMPHGYGSSTKERRVGANRL